LVASSAELQFRSGPLPSPRELAEYDTVLAGAAERIIVMAERQAAHRQKLEEFAIRAEDRRSWGGLVAGCIVAVGFMVGSVLLGLNGQPWQGAVLGSTTLASIVGTFVYGTRSRRAERERK
jgi:uncharacterized membrane protein